MFLDRVFLPSCLLYTSQPDAYQGAGSGTTDTGDAGGIIAVRMQSAEGAVTKDIAEAKAERLLYWLGFRPTYKGFAYLACGIQLAAQDSDYLTHLTTALYPAIAQHFQTTADSVERSLRTAIQAFWKNGDVYKRQAEYGTTFIERTEGNYLIKPDGTRLLDFYNQLYCVNAGQNVPEIQAGIKDALDRYGFVWDIYTTDYKAEVSKLLIEDILKDSGWAAKVRYALGGGDAVETCLLYTSRCV